MLSTKPGWKFETEVLAPKNTVFGIVLSRLLNISGPPRWIRTSRSMQICARVSQGGERNLVAILVGSLPHSSTHTPPECLRGTDLLGGFACALGLRGLGHRLADVLGIDGVY